MRNINTESGSPLQINKKMWKSKKGIMALVVPALVLVGLAVVGYGALKGFGIIGQSQDTEPRLQITSQDVAVDPVTKEVSVSNCGSDKSTDFDIVAFNPLDLDGTPTYHNVTLYAMSSNGGALRSYTTEDDGTFPATSLKLNCPSSYEIYAPATENSTASAKFSVSTTTPNADALIPIEQLDHITVYAYDNKNRGFVYDASDADATDGEELTATKTFKSTTNNATAYAMSTGGSLDWTFSVYTGTTQRSWGDLQNYIVIDADKSDFGTPSLTWAGTPLTEVGKSALTEDDAAYLSAYEYVFKLPEDVTEVQKELRLKVNAKSGVDPDVDIKVRFVAESYYVDGTEVKRGIFNSGGDGILMEPAQEVTIDIS